MKWGSIMKKNISNMFIAALFMVPCTMQARVDWERIKTLGVTGAVLNVMSVGLLAAHDLHQKGSKWAQVVEVTTWAGGALTFGGLVYTNVLSVDPILRGLSALGSDAMLQQQVFFIGVCFCALYTVGHLLDNINSALGRSL
jgi:hypothetical protein